MTLLREKFLPFVVFSTGTVNLIIEIAAFRLLAPYFGNTIFTTSSVIGVILLALSLGYYFGGLLGDRKPKYSLLFITIFLGGALSIIMFSFAKPLLSLIVQFSDIKTGPIISSLILLLLPNFLLGMISPFVIKLKSLSSEKIGRISGGIFFWGTIGSIVGNFLAGFFLIPFLGVTKILIFSGMYLMVLGLTGWFLTRERENKIQKIKSTLLILITLFLFIFSSFMIVTESLAKTSLYEKEGLYSKISVIRAVYKDHPTTFLLLDNAYESGMFLDSDELAFDYTKYFFLYNLINPEPKNALFIGGGGYTLPRQIILREPQIEKVDVAEIDPALFDIAHKYFKLPIDPRISNNIQDGRYFLQHSQNQYDVIYLDAFDNFSIPSHLFTKEFFTLGKNKLSNKGIFLVNVVGTLKKDRDLFIVSAIKTFKNVFPNSFFFAVKGLEEQTNQNFSFVGFKDDKFQSDFSSLASKQARDEEIADIMDHLIKLPEERLGKGYTFTDDFSPIDYLTEKSL
jgi:spermidine synthase